MEEIESDEDLLAAHLRGDAEAFSVLFDRHQLPIYRYLLRLLRIQANAEDVLQDTFMTVLRNASQFRSESGFRAWLFSIARSRLVDHLRRQGKESSLDDMPENSSESGAAGAEYAWMIEAAPGPEAQAMSRQQARAFLDQVEALPGTQREVFLLHAEGDMSVPEIARSIGIATETAKSRLRYALARLRNAMEAMS
jgi:RNA polymerase sigma-70 factor (ECF subfamily)